MKNVKSGTIKHSSGIDFTGDIFKRSHETKPGYYVMFGMWKGPFPNKEEARDAYVEWSHEARFS